MTKEGKIFLISNESKNLIPMIETQYSAEDVLQALREKAREIEVVTDEVRAVAERMIELMYELPDLADIATCHIDLDVVNKSRTAILGKRRATA